MATRFTSILGIFILSLLSISRINAQCSPDTSIKSTGIFPLYLDTADISVPYSQVIQFFITKDTLVFVPEYNQNLNATIDSITITTVEGLPSGFTYVCSDIKCKANGGQTGCIKIQGTAQPGQGGVYSMRVKLLINATIMFGPLKIQNAKNDSNDKYFIVVRTPSGFNEFSKENIVNIYPNPAKNILNVQFRNLENINVEYEIYDLSGKFIKTGNISEAFDSELKIGISELRPGSYMLRLNNDGKSINKIFVVD